MKHNTTIKEIHNIKYYTGSHPEIRAQYKAGKRPTEFGNKVWATTLVLLDYFEKKPFDLQGLRVLEIGCGQGLLGVYLTKVHSCKVVCTDLDEHVLPIVKMQARLNNISIETKQAGFNDLTSSFLKNFDLIIGAEVCYCEEVTQDIIKLIQIAFDVNVEHILIADPGRPDFDDCHAFCEKYYKTKRIELPGSINGKITNLLSAYSQ